MRWILLSLMALTSACWGEDEEPPGELVGSFQTLGLMVEQSCGAAVPAPDPIDLKFDLRSESNGRAYWRLWGGAMFAGLEKNDTYTFQTSQSWMVIEPDRFRGYVGCSVTQRDVFTFEVSVPEVEPGLDAGVEDDAGVKTTGARRRGGRRRRRCRRRGLDRSDTGSDHRLADHRNRSTERRRLYARGGCAGWPVSLAALPRRVRPQRHRHRFRIAEG